MNYIEVTFDITPYEEAVADALISELGTIGYDGFSYTDQGFTAYIPAKDYNAQAITRLEIFDFFTRNYRIETSVQEIEDQDWNKVWEENFTPIVVDDRILVRAGFHAPVPGRGIPTNRSSAQNSPRPALACSFSPPCSPFSRQNVKNRPMTGLSLPLRRMRRAKR